MPVDGNIFVGGDGPEHSPLMLVGEAPAHNEEAQGRPFVGMTGRETDNYIRRYLGFGREFVYVTNLIKHALHDWERKKDSKTGLHLYDKELEMWGEMLLDEIRSVDPDVIMSLGAISTHWFLGLSRKKRFNHDMEAVSGIPHWWDEDGSLTGRRRIVVPSFHPAAGFRTNSVMSWIIKAFEAVHLVLEGKMLPRPPADPTIELDEWYEPPGHDNLISLDTETKLDGTTYMVQASLVPGSAIYAFAERSKGQKLLNHVSRYVEREGVTVVMQNALFDIPKLAQVGIYPRKWVDTMLVAFLIQTLPLGLKSLAYHLCGMEMREYEDVVTNRGYKDLTEVDDDDAIDYACKDPDATMRVWYKMLPMWYNRMDELMEVDMGIQPVLLAMMARGFKANARFFYDMAGELAIRNMELQERMIEEFPIVQSVANHKTYKSARNPFGAPGTYRVDDFNPGSDKQVAELLYKVLGLGKTKKIENTKWGGSVDQDNLKKVETEHPIVTYLQQYAETQTLIDDFALPLPEKIGPDGRIHAKISMIRIPHSGRLACSNPNLMAQPTRTEDGKKMREGFEATPGFILHEYDYSQIEMRLMAHISRDEVMCDDFINNRDIHTMTAMRAFGISREEDVDEMKHRYPAKRTGFGVLNDISPEGLARELLDGGAGVWTEEACQQFLDSWFGIYKGVRRYKNWVMDQAKRYQEVMDMWGRRELIPQVVSAYRHIREAGLRVAGNQQIQSGAQGVIKRSMVKLWPTVREWIEEDLVYPIMQIHDSLIFEVREEFQVEAEPTIKRIMEGTVELEVPVKVDVKRGYKWGTMKK